MIIDQKIKCPFSAYLDNETDDKLRDFVSARQVDTKEVKKVAERKIKELIDIIAVCMNLEKDFKEAQK